MAQPPRLPAIYLPWEQSVIYFVTFCVARREQVLANGAIHRAVAETTGGLRSWEVIAGVIMPEHLHCFVCPKIERDLSIGDFSNAFKRLLRQSVGTQNWEWQRGCFDHLLRSDESFSEKWAYVRENPVRARLVQRWEDWPYFFGLIEQQRVEAQRQGKLAVSPTSHAAPASDCRGSC